MNIFFKKKIIIGIHGLGNKPSKALLEKWWKNALFEGLSVFGKTVSDFNFELVYWADILHPEPQDLNITDEDNPLYLDHHYVKASDYTVKPLNKTRQKFLDYLEKAMDDLFLNDDLTINFSKMTDKILHKYFKDLDAYYNSFMFNPSKTNNNARQRIRKRLIDCLRKHRNKDILLISHSMGTIIAFDVLSQHPNDFQIDTFVTMGSPLGIPVVKGKIAAELSKMRIPTPFLKAPENIIRNWYNLSDLEDRIAINYNLADDYEPNSRGIDAVDKIISNNYSYNGEANPHSSYGYLRTPEMIRIIEDFIEYDHQPVVKWMDKKLNRISEIYRKLIQKNKV